MNTKILAVVMVAAAAVMAAGTGAYFAVRQNRLDPKVAASGTVTTDVASTPDSAAVSETEATLTESEVPVAVEKPAPAPPVSAREVKRAEPSRPAAKSTRAASVPAPAPRREPVSSATHTEASHPPVSVERVDPAPSPAPWSTDQARTVPEVPMPPPAPVVPPAPEYADLTIPSEAVIGLQIENNVSSETARIEDRVDARVTRDVRAGGMVAIPAGSKVQGSVTMVDKGGKVKERARLGVRFHTVVLADGTRVPIQTETVVREGDSPSGQSAAKIGGAAVGGAILGAILGGGKGAAIGGSVGAAGGTAAVMAGSREPATLTAGSTVTVRLSNPTTVTVEKKDDNK